MNNSPSKTENGDWQTVKVNETSRTRQQYLLIVLAFLELTIYFWVAIA